MKGCRNKGPFAVLFGWLLCASMGYSQDPSYEKPPAAIADVLNAPPPPLVSVSPQRDHLLLIDNLRYPPIADLARPWLSLAGERIDPRTNGPHLPPRITGYQLQAIPQGQPKPLATPREGQLGIPLWSPDGSRFAFTLTGEQGISLWWVEVATGKPQQIPGVQINATWGSPVQWLGDSRTLVCQTVVAERGPPPAPTAAPGGPIIQESQGKAGPVRTFQDLLRNPHDEQLFDYYFTSQLVLADTAAGTVTRIGEPSVFAEVAPSADSQHLLVERVQRPYSYLYPASYFPTEVEVWSREGKFERRLASLPLADQIPIEGVPVGPRNYEWRPDEPATLTWVEALDEGDPRNKVPFRDQVYMWSYPFDGQPAQVVKTEHRFAGLTWAQTRSWALLRDYDRDRRWSRTFLLSVGRRGEPKLIWDRSVLDRYNDPGTPLMRTLPNGQRVLWQDGDHIFLSGAGASPEGDRPFLDRLNLNTLASTRLFQSAPDQHEAVLSLISENGQRFLTRHESPLDPPNYFLRDGKTGERLALTNFPDPAPALRKIQKQLVTYPREDGVQLSFTLYLPPDYQPGTPLPTVLWAYPREFTDPGTAGQVVGSPNRFTSIQSISHLFFLLDGYAVLDGATMPVVGDPETVNNTYIAQTVASARAAIEKAVELKVTDPQRVGVGGHSYGAFMAANLLAHSDLFRAGIARSGAYNRTLTPFGFQSERRTLWEAPDMYVKNSPFMQAHRINEPLLLIHGAADDNPGTFPMQSDRMFQAIRGNGGTVRYVSLPYESHGYVARESVEHTLYEMLAWFNRYVKQASPRESAPTAAESAAGGEEEIPERVQEEGAGEGPAWHPELGLFTSGGGHIYRRDRQGHVSVFRKDAGSNGLLWDSQGRLLICEAVARRVTRLEPDGRLVVLADQFEGKRFNQPNDLALDSQGRIYFSDPRYGDRSDMQIRDASGRAIEGVYRIDPDGKVTRIITHEVDRPNGLIVTPDDRFLFVADNNNDTVGGARKLWRFQLRADGGIEPESQTLIHDWQTTRGPDGMKLDEQGRLYVAAGRHKPQLPFETADPPTAGIYVFSPEGKLLRQIPIPQDEVTNCAFGDEDRRSLFVTAGGSLWRIRVK